MAEIHTEKKFSPSSFSAYHGGALNGKVSGTTQTGKIDRFQGWSRFNGAHLDEPRISSFSREDSFSYSSLYKEKPHESDVKKDQRQSTVTAGNGNASKSSLRNGSKACSSSHEPVSAVVDASTAEGKALRSSGSGVPPLAGGSPGANRSGNSTQPNLRDENSAASSGLVVHGRSSSSDDSLNKDHHGTHRRRMSDVGTVTVDSLFNGEPRRNVSGEMSSSGSSTGGNTPKVGNDSSPYWSRSDSGRFSSKDGSSWSSSSPSVLNLKVSSSPVVDSPSPRASTSSSGGSSRGSSVAGSPTVGRASSTGNLFGKATGLAPSESTPTTNSRSSSCSIGQLRGGSCNVGALSTSGGNAKSAVPNKPAQNVGFPAPVGIICGPNHSRLSIGGVTENGGKSNGTAVKPSYSPVKPDGLRASADAGRGNIIAVGESLLIKRVLASSDPEEVKNAGNDQYKKGSFVDALSLYDRAVSLAPGRASYRSNRAATLICLGRLTEAYQECEESLKLDPQYVRALQRLVSLCIRLGRIERAKKIVKSNGQHIEIGDIQKVDKIENHLIKCFDARKASDWSTVIRESEGAVAAGADSAPQIVALKAEALVKLSKPEEADAVLQGALKGENLMRKSSSSSADTNILCVMAQINMSLGRFDDAVTVAEKAALLEPHNPEVSDLLKKARAVATARATGNDLFKADRWLEAAIAYGEGLQYNPTNAVLLCNRAACRSKLGLYEKAIEDCNAALDAYPNHLKALLRRGHSNSKLERWKDALRDYEILKRELPGDAEVARSYFDVQVALRKHHGEGILPKWFGGEIEDITSNDQLREALSHPGIAVVLFSSTWSERSRQIVPVVEQLCKKNPTVNFLKVDVQTNAYLAKAESVEFVPTLKIYKNGYKVKELLGPSQETLEHAVSHFSH